MPAPVGRCVRTSRRKTRKPGGFARPALQAAVPQACKPVYLMRDRFSGLYSTQRRCKHWHPLIDVGFTGGRTSWPGTRRPCFGRKVRNPPMTFDTSPGHERHERHAGRRRWRPMCTRRRQHGCSLLLRRHVRARPALQLNSLYDRSRSLGLEPWPNRLIDHCAPGRGEDPPYNKEHGYMDRCSRAHNMLIGRMHRAPCTCMHVNHAPMHAFCACWP